MHKFIIVLSLVFFALSGIVIFKALEIPLQETHYKKKNPKGLKSKTIPPESEDILKQFAKEQAANRALVKELQATIAKLEDKLSEKDSVEPKEPEKQPRVLAVLGAGTFSSGQVIINKDMMETIKGLVPEIMASPDYRVIIEGHTDNKPIRSSTGKRFRDNMELSFLRAKAVADLLVKYGIPLERISVIGYGDTRPIAPNETDEGRAKNRRVEIKLIPEDRGF